MQFRVGHEWLVWDCASRLISPIAVPRASKDPAIYLGDKVDIEGSALSPDGAESVQ